MRRESGLDLRLLQGFPRSVPLHRPEPPQLRERDDGRRASMDQQRTAPDPSSGARDVEMLVTLVLLYMTNRPGVVHERDAD